jgi:ribonuclease HII
MARENPAEKLIRMTAFEVEYWARGIAVAGIDEVGRGPLAGPVVTACVILPESALIPGVDDSKKLSPARREALSEAILARAEYVQFARVEAAEIDRINILNATRRAMEECAQEAPAGVFLIDALDGLRLPAEARAIVHGDALSYMIAAASIVAKVYRDRLMDEMDALYPGYGFAKHKGYGTAEHIRALRELGPCPEHRRSFLGGILGERLGA